MLCSNLSADKRGPIKIKSKQTRNTYIIIQKFKKEVEIAIKSNESSM